MTSTSSIALVKPLSKVSVTSIIMLSIFLLTISKAPLHTAAFSRSLALSKRPPIRSNKQLFLSTTITFDPSPTIRDKATSTILIGRHSSLSTILSATDSYVTLFGFRPPPSVMMSMLDSVKNSGSTSSHVEVPTVGPAAPRPPHVMAVCSVKDGVSRNVHKMSLHGWSEVIAASCGKTKSNKKDKSVVHVICAVEEELECCGPIGGAVGRAFPLFSRKTKGGGTKSCGEEELEEEDGNDGTEEEERVVHVTFIDSRGKVVKESRYIEAAKAAADGVRLACRLVDTPPEELTTTAFAQECHNLFQDEPNVSIEEIIGEELRKKGYGGIYNVGKGAVEEPRLVILTYDPNKTGGDNHEQAAETNSIVNDDAESKDCIALIGKGIVYDTGGLAIKSKTGMCGMKSDMGGAAGVLGGFLAAVRLQTPRKIRLLLCLAENAIGPKSVRNDDIITIYSGKTVEINNSDAEGRLVLSDAVAHATKHYSDVGLVVDMATLTGAQLIATGKTHAGILANTLELERRAVDAGLRSGDLCYPLVYAPELLKKEFASKVADMKNSVKDRGNAQSSCAGHFIESHIDPNYKGEWLHVDMAGPAWKSDRGTGYGVGLVLALVGAPGFCEGEQ